MRQDTYGSAAHGIESTYLVAPTSDDPLTAMRPFLDVALNSGVKRFVFLSVSSIEQGGPMHGQVHRYLN